MRARSLRLAAAPLLLTLALLALGAPRALADLPPPPILTMPPVLVLAGQSPDGADPASSFTVGLQFPNGEPAAGSVVVLDFSACDGVRLCANQPYPGLAAVDCAGARVMAISNLNGRVTFRVVGAASGMPAGACPPANCVRVIVDGMLLGHTRVVTPDLDGAGGLGPNDLSLWLDLHFADTNCSLADFDGSGVLGPNDLSLWLAWDFAGGSTQSCAGASCP